MKLESATLRYVRGPRTVPRKLRALLAVDPSGVLDQRVQTDFSKGWEELASSDYLVAPSVPRLDAVVVVQEPGAALPTAIESKVCGASNILFFLAKQCGLDGKNAMQEIDCASLDAVGDAIVDAVAQCPPEQRATPMGRRGCGRCNMLCYMVENATWDPFQILRIPRNKMFEFCLAFARHRMRIEKLIK